MRIERKSHAQNTCPRRLLRPVFPFHARTSGHYQRKGEALGQHDRLRARADRRSPHDVWSSAHPGGAPRSRHEESENFNAPRIRSSPTCTAVPDASRGTRGRSEGREAVGFSLSPLFHGLPLSAACKFFRGLPVHSQLDLGFAPALAVGLAFIGYASGGT